MLMTGPPIGVLLVDDSRPFRNRLKRHLAEDPAIAVVGEAADGVSAIGEIERLAPDVVLLDLYMPEPDGFGILRVVKERFDRIIVIVLTSDASEMVRRRCAMLGAAAVVDKGDAPAELLSTLHGLVAHPFT
jgi:DNA-binding NarL/FixJ family response regulator